MTIRAALYIFAIHKLMDKNDQTRVGQEIERLEFDERAVWAFALDPFTGLYGRICGIKPAWVRAWAQGMAEAIKDYREVIQVEPDQIADWSYLVSLRLQGMDPVTRGLRSET